MIRDLYKNKIIIIIVRYQSVKDILYDVNNDVNNL